MRAARLLAAGLLLLPLAGCAEGSVTAPDLATRVDLDTPELRAIKREAGMADCPRLRGDRSELPDLTLPCLGGGPDVRLSSVAGPAVVPVWAQWCGPCREELPWFQRLHEAAGDRLTVLGVNWEDLQPDGALTFARLAGVTFPSVADPDATLPDVRGLPVLYLVDGSGAVTVKRGQVTGYEELVALVAQHTGVTVPAGDAR